ncbi:TRAP transporter, DctM subunit [Thermanaeromonas toyohensis ToBE]|uniref:TRAP transporter, DctM subunit n=1 Tax=Thermanaeromonas toyohensis ToBE TaxID=698762 RepID=A0A1W1W019_9FIRM|nr:TRAP transporter large permease [Thermanaeromonas toyohensis]SMB98464.1 TRAP transporter, DctM subunit [Thermanaeromonas toyohensis ToBE]
MVYSFMAIFALLMCLGIPIAIALGGSALVYLLLKGDLSLTILVQTTYGGLASFPLVAIPLFMLAGVLMNESGITKDLIRFARTLLGHISGGLGMATVLAAAIFSAISGTAVATAVAIGSIMIPAMKEAGYDEEVAAALTATASCMGPIIPPSVPFIMYGVIANVSISALFLGGVVPGLLLGLGLMIYISILAKQRKYPQEGKPSVAEVVKAAWKALPALFMPILVLGGILGGIFTPTEAAGIAVVYALIIDLLLYRNIKLRRLPTLLLTAGVEAAVVMLLLGLSEPFAWVIAVEQIPQRIVEAMAQATSSPLMILLLVNIALLIIGIPLETAPALTIVTPVLAPLAAQVGIDPIQLGVVVVFNLVLGLITPPVGAVLFSVCSIAGLSLEKLSKEIWVPFLIGITVLFLITFIPSLTTILPSLFVRQ